MTTTLVYFPREPFFIFSETGISALSCIMQLSVLASHGSSKADRQALFSVAAEAVNVSEHLRISSLLLT